MKKNLSLVVVASLFLFSGIAAAASIPILGWPTSARGINLAFGGDWTKFASTCTSRTWRHTGIDLNAKNGTPVYAAEAGTVKVSQSSGTAWKDWVTIEHKDSRGNKYTTNYWHLKNRKVGVGASVKKGQHIADVADMGRNSHLHFGVYNGAYSNTANRGGLPVTTCDVYPAYPSLFVNPKNYLK